MLNLEKSGLFWGCDLPITNEEFSTCRTLNLGPNATMFFSTDQLECIYYLDEGVVSFNLSSHKKTKKIYWKCKSLINSFLIFLNDYGFQLQTMTDVTFKVMNANDFKERMRCNNKFLKEVIMYNAYSSYCYINQLSLMCFYDSHAKLDQFYKAVHEYDTASFEDFISCGSITQKTIAEALSLHPVTISKAVKNKKV
ncbi:MAG: hypothetical protein APF76_02970 [Desulfitibacter sp. BRH_c19]|nr:MAG: hypothetical protein APF76_02970 [Desulfitibacter sp. BRH_c19]